MTPNAGKAKRVLIVSFLFPPANSIAAVRLGKFAKYLPQFGWEPIVLTADTTRDRPQTLAVEIDEANVFRMPLSQFFRIVKTKFSKAKIKKKVSIRIPVKEIKIT